MSHLVEDLLTLARLDSGRPLDAEPLDPARLVLDAVSDARVRSPGHRWQLELPEDELELRGDVRALHQVVANLLANAASHTPDGTTVTASVSADDDWLVIAVHDDGAGIASDVAARVFDRFVRADSARAHGEGSGLGLSIVAAIVEAHGGATVVDSRPGSTTFTVKLPRKLAGRGGVASDQ